MLSPSRADPHLRRKILKRVNQRFSVDYEEEPKSEVGDNKKLDLFFVCERTLSKLAVTIDFFNFPIIIATRFCLPTLKVSTSRMETVKLALTIYLFFLEKVKNRQLKKNSRSDHCQNYPKSR